MAKTGRRPFEGRSPSSSADAALLHSPSSSADDEGERPSKGRLPYLAMTSHTNSDIKSLEYRKFTGDLAKVAERKDISALKREIDEDLESNDVPPETSLIGSEDIEMPSSPLEEVSQTEEISDFSLNNDVNIFSTTMSPTTCPTSVSYKESRKENDDMKMTNVLNEVLKDIDEKLQQPNKSPRDGVPCHINGTWVSKAGGIVLSIDPVINGTLIVTATNTTPPSKNGILSTAWGITGNAPFVLGAPFMLTAINKNEKKMAAFIGQCKVCEGRDVVSGTWIFGRGARDCDDVQLATIEHRDVFHREFLHFLLNNTSHSNNTLQHA